MKTVLLVSAHFPPSNLVSIHRARLLANHLQAFGWKPIVVTVHPRYYEETLDPHMEKLVEPFVEVIRAPAIPQSIARPFGVGDIGLRGFFGLLTVLHRLIQDRRPDLLMITIPSNYQALLGRILFEFHQVPYIIDYQDPWVDLPSQRESLWSKSGFTRFLSKTLEPLAVARASGISGMAPGYFEAVLHRYPALRGIPTLAFQMGFSIRDHEMARELGLSIRRLPQGGKRRAMVYAGALLPKAIEPMKCFLKALGIANRTELKGDPLQFICLGTGSASNDPKSYRIRPLAIEQNAEPWVDEFPERHPYLEVLATLEASFGVAVIGSTEPHYSPSKVFQAALSKKPLIALLHGKSEAYSILNRAGGSVVVELVDPIDQDELTKRCVAGIIDFSNNRFAPNNPVALEPYDARMLCGKVSKFFETVVQHHEWEHS